MNRQIVGMSVAGVLFLVVVGYLVVLRGEISDRERVANLVQVTAKGLATRVNVPDSGGSGFSSRSSEEKPADRENPAPVDPELERIINSWSDRQVLGGLMVLGQHPLSEHNATQLVRLRGQEARLSSTFSTQGENYELVWDLDCRGAIPTYRVVSDSSPYSRGALAQKGVAAMQRFWAEKSPVWREKLRDVAQISREDLTRAAVVARQKMREGMEQAAEATRRAAQESARLTQQGMSRAAEASRNAAHQAGRAVSDWLRRRR